MTVELFICEEVFDVWQYPGPYLYKIKLKRVIITANHDRLKLCQDREFPEWAQKLSRQNIQYGCQGQ
jgi:hypothetical protein